MHEAQSPFFSYRGNRISYTVDHETLIPLGGELLEVNHADTSWLLMASALVLLMTPGLAFLRWYGAL